MASENAKRDGNFVPTLLGVSSADGESTVNIWVNPSTHRVLTSPPSGFPVNITVTVTSAQLKNLIASPVVLVPAPGAGKAIVPISILASLNYNSVQYTSGGQANPSVGINVTVTADMANFIRFLGDNLAVFAITYTDFNGASTGVLNTPLSLFNYSGNDFEDGDSDLILNITYQIQTTGL